MGKLFFIPFSIASGLLAGLLGKKITGQVWGMMDQQEPPEPKHRDIRVGKMVVALAIQGAIFAAVRGAMDHYARALYMRLTGTWPGEEEPEPE